MIRYAAALGLLLTTTAVAAAQTLDEQIVNFVGAPGFATQDVAGLNNRLDQNWLDQDSVSPGGAVGPLEKAMLIAETGIGSTRTRSAISYGEVIAEDGTPVSFIEVRHYNMAAPLHAETVDAYGVEDTADVADFGEGEHKAWRFVFQPMMNNVAVLVEASVRVISPEEAAKDDCLGQPCLALDAEDNHPMDWTEIDGTLPSWPELYPSDGTGIATPAATIAQIAVLGYWASAESGSYQWTGGEHPEAARDATPYRFIGIDRNLGQDDSIATDWHETLLNDDSMSELAYRYIGVIGQVWLMQATKPR
ncbi:hypothetical protein [Devosia sp. FKR38]|uniref:hypothetical protein n=1 Tax=Devosia sp. FKR38 TaxID=2562312 RepID=UPI0010C0386C|nr:hypothetical protein [Devosia sp. FKR38]